VRKQTIYRGLARMASMEFPVLQTERLLLREIVRPDAPRLFEIYEQSKLMRWFGSEALPDVGAVEELIASFAASRQSATHWGLQLKDDARLIGTCGLFAWNRPWRHCSLEFELAPSLRGKGLMQEALAAVFGWGFTEMGLHRIGAQVHPLNFGSLRLLRTMGFVQEGSLREIGCWGGAFHDLLQLSLLEREFASVRQGPGGELPAG